LSVVFKNPGRQGKNQFGIARKFRVKSINEMVVKFRKIKDVAIEVVA